jgi:hypothetical protein
MKRRNQKNEQFFFLLDWFQSSNKFENVCIPMSNIFEKLTDFHAEWFPT